MAIVAHRGASGYRPEHTRGAYELAVRMGADYIEPDLVMTKDSVLVDRHEPDVSETTDVRDHPELTDRQATKDVDGAPVTGWFTEDLTLAELKTLRAIERLGHLRGTSRAYDGRFEVLTFEECLQLRAELSARSGRPIGIMPEIKHPTHLHDQGFAPELEVLRLLEVYDLGAADAPVWIQSFEPTALQILRSEGYRGRSMLLTKARGAPFDLHEQGTTWAELTTPAGMADLARWIDGFGPQKQQVIPWDADGAPGGPTTLVRDAHAAGLAVVPWTFRAENVFLPLDHRIGDDPAAHGRLVEEVVAHLEAGVDGIFCDQPDLCVEARSQFLARR